MIKKDNYFEIATNYWQFIYEETRFPLVSLIVLFYLYLYSCSVLFFFFFALRIPNSRSKNKKINRPPMTDETNPGTVLGKSPQMATQLTKWQNTKEQSIT